MSPCWNVPQAPAEHVPSRAPLEGKRRRDFPAGPRPDAPSRGLIHTGIVHCPGGGDGRPPELKSLPCQGEGGRPWATRQQSFNSTTRVAGLRNLVGEEHHETGTSH